MQVNYSVEFCAGGINNNTKTADNLISNNNEILRHTGKRDENIWSRNIHTGHESFLPQIGNFSPAIGAEENEEITTADKFDEWTGEETFDKFLNGEEIEDFEMFEFDAATYSTDLKDFAQEYIDKYDESGDGKLNLEEFTDMAAGEDISEYNSEALEELYQQLFDSLNLDEEDDTISAEEFATMLYASDMDWNNYSETGGDVVSSLDGKLDWINYQSYSSLLPSTDAEDNTQYENLQYQRQLFYDNYYAE